MLVLGIIHWRFSRFERLRTSRAAAFCACVSVGVGETDAREASRCACRCDEDRLGVEHSGVRSAYSGTRYLMLSGEEFSIEKPTSKSDTWQS